MDGARGKKRKQADQEREVFPAPAPVQLEMLTDEEDADEINSDGGEADEFPEIDPDSDSDEDEDYNEELSSEDENSEDTEESAVNSGSSDSDTSLHIFPIAKTVISNITGQKKVEYPDIDPEYDSDSSTEDVRLSLVYSQTSLSSPM